MNCVHHPEAVESVGPQEYGPDPPALDVQRQQAVADLAVVPRCPRCRAPLIARMTCLGPSFACHCEEHRFG